MIGTWNKPSWVPSLTWHLAAPGAGSVLVYGHRPFLIYAHGLCYCLMPAGPFPFMPTGLLAFIPKGPCPICWLIDCIELPHDILSRFIAIQFDIWCPKVVFLRQQPWRVGKNYVALARNLRQMTLFMCRHHFLTCSFNYRDAQWTDTAQLRD